ncbi:MAG: hypothetical protein ACREN6_02665 [Gemmatimonadaceae bacterium]
MGAAVRTSPANAPTIAADAPGWECFPGSSRLQAWAYELLAACEAAETAQGADVDWDLTGRAALVVSDEMRGCRAALQLVAADAGMQFVFVPEDELFDQPSLAERQLAAPMLVCLEPGDWLGASKGGERTEKSEAIERFRAQLAQWVRDFDPAHPVVFATSAFTITDLPESLREAGLFDRFFSLPAPTMVALGNTIINRIGREQCAESITASPGKVGRLFRMEYDSDRREALALLRLRRLLASETRALEFLDLANMAARGFVEEDVPPTDARETNRNTAYHEAGHAAVAVIDSNGKNTPDYISIVPSSVFEGIVVESYQFHTDLADRVTYETFRHNIRIRLAGRAAEELVFGAEQVTNGARRDLEQATGSAGAAFTFWGFAPSMDVEGRAASNLKVAKLGDDPFSASEAAHVEKLVQEFLTTEYGVVKDMLAKHRPFVDAIAEQLLRDRIVDQGAVAELAQRHRAVASAQQVERILSQ